MKIVAASFLVLSVFGVGSANAKENAGLIPPGWKQEESSWGGAKSKRFVSPDGRASLVAEITPADESPQEHMDDIAHKWGEQLTSDRRTLRGVAVSGVKGDRLFYRRSTMSCDDKTWLTVELDYLADQKHELAQMVRKVTNGLDSYTARCSQRSRTTRSTRNR